MKSRLLLILVFPFLLGCKKEILIFPYTKGYIYSKKEEKPIKNAAFYSPYIGDKFKNDILVKSSVSSDDNGFFFLICKILDYLSYNYYGKFKFWKDFREFFISLIFSRLFCLRRWLRG